MRERKFSVCLPEQNRTKNAKGLSSKRLYYSGKDWPHCRSGILLWIFGHCRLWVGRKWHRKTHKWISHPSRFPFLSSSLNRGKPGSTSWCLEPGESRNVQLRTGTFFLLSSATEVMMRLFFVLLYTLLANWFPRHRIEYMKSLLGWSTL